MSIVRGNDELAYFLSVSEHQTKEVFIAVNISYGCCPLFRLHKEPELLIIIPEHHECGWDWWDIEARRAYKATGEVIARNYGYNPIEEVYDHFMKKHFSLTANIELINVAHAIVEKLLIVYRNTKTKNDMRKKNSGLKCIALRELNKDIGIPVQALAAILRIDIKSLGDMLYQGMVLKGKPRWVENVERTE